MRLDPNPLFRKVITPWYDGNAACIILLIAMVIAIVFSLFGIATARHNPDFHRHTWVPVTMLILCLFVVASVTRRLIQRFYARHSQTSARWSDDD